MRVFIFLISAVFSFNTFAQDRAEKIRTLMEAQGLVETFEQQIQLAKESSKQQADQVLSQMLSGLRPPPVFEEKFREAALQFSTEAQPTWTSHEIVDVWAKYYGTNFNDAELNQLLAYYTSPLAQKEVLVSRAALTQFTVHFQELYKPVMQKATQSFIERLQIIVRDCNCRQ